MRERKIKCVNFAKCVEYKKYTNCVKCATNV